MGNWLKGHLPMDVDGYTESNRILEDDGSVFFETQKPRTGDPRRRNLRIVCRDCNGTWMKSLLDGAKPFVEKLMHGNPLSLSFRDQTKLMSWFVLAGMTGDFVGYKLGTIPQSERNYIREFHRVPRKWRVWLGRYKRHKSKIYWHAGYLQVLREDEPEARSAEPHGAVIPNTQTFTMVLGELYVTMLRSDDRPLIRNWTFDPASLLVEMV